jgi:hypothetical protein
MERGMQLWNSDADLRVRLVGAESKKLHLGKPSETSGGWRGSFSSLLLIAAAQEEESGSTNITKWLAVRTSSVSE